MVEPASTGGHERTEEDGPASGRRAQDETDIDLAEAEERECMLRRGGLKPGPACPSQKHLRSRFC